MREIKAIASKSDAHRALICAALSENPCEVIMDTTSKDIDATKKCIESIRCGQKELYCGESGSTLRFLLPVVAALGMEAHFYPEGRLPKRPLSPLYEEMENHGCKMSPKESVPFIVKGQLQSGDFTIPVYIDWKNNKVLLYSTGNYIQYPVRNPNEKEYEKNVYICITESLFCTAEINTTL